jgi:hypothetical protein
MGICLEVNNIAFLNIGRFTLLALIPLPMVGTPTQQRDESLVAIWLLICTTGDIGAVLAQDSPFLLPPELRGGIRRLARTNLGLNSEDKNLQYVDL